MGSIRVLVTPRPFDSKGQEHLQRLRDAGYEVEWNDTGKRFTREDLEGRIGNVDALLTGNDPLDQDMLARAKKLKVISKYGVGLDNIDLTCAKEMGISVYKALGANSDAVAEFAVLLMMAAQRQLYQLSQGTKSRESLRLVGHEATGKAIGLVGLGAIGRNVARIELKERPDATVALDNYLITPHAASFTVEADQKTMAVSVDNIIKGLEQH